MRLAELLTLYLLIGVGAAIVVALRSPSPRARWVDSALLVPFWPLYGPFVLSQRPPPTADAGEVGFLVALRRAAGTPLSALLPDEQTARALARRLRVASDKLAEIEALLQRPEFDEQRAVNRRHELVTSGASASALATAQSRLQNIQRLRRLRDRFARELLELQELLAQLTTQAEVVRLAGVPDSEAEDLVREIVCRVEGLDGLLDDGDRIGDPARV